MKMSTAMQLLGYPAEFVQDEREREKPDPLREYAEQTWPAKGGHKAGCSAYYSLEKCECQRPDWKQSSAGNYPRDPNPPMMERDPRCRD